MTPANVSSPIINRPYDPPEWHWQRHPDGRIVDAEQRPGRYPAVGQLPNVRGLHLRNSVRAMGDMTDLQPHLDMVNDIRDQVRVWQSLGYSGITPVTRDLIGHWTDPDRRALYFAQKEAILTAIWLTEVAPGSDAGRAILDELTSMNVAINDGVQRVCHQMATGTGKTAVMAAIIVWQTCNHRAYPDDRKFTNEFLAITPGITVQERLEAGLQYMKHGQPDQNTEYLNPHLQLVPARYEAALRHIRVRVVNYHKFIARDQDGNIPARVKTFVRLSSNVENDEQVICRVLGLDARPMIVFNDEAHHCHQGSPGGPGTPTSGTERYVWFNALKMLRDFGLLHGPVRDLSATPSFITERRSPLFPWLVSQYSLQEAEEAGIVKIMRLPSAASRPDYWDDELARSIYSKTRDGKSLTREDDDSDNRDLKNALQMIYQDWDATRLNANWRQRNVPPVLAVIVNSVANANRLFDYIAGWEADGVLYPGRLGNELSNVDLHGSGYHSYQRTILVHSRLDDPDARETGESQKYLRHQAEMYRNVYPAAVTPANVPFPQAADKDVIRTVLNSVGKQDEPGEHVRCVVSVGMLTEGWDARTVTHIVGFRRFGTQLICEQVSGRALRRVAHDSNADGYLYPEYADILGIPFDNLTGSAERNTHPPPAPPPHYEVRLLEERTDYRIRWPHVLDYRRRQGRNPLTLRRPDDWSSVPSVRVQSHQYAHRIRTAPEVPVGEHNPLSELPATVQEFHYLVAKNVVDVLTELEHDDATVSRTGLFQQSLTVLREASGRGLLAGPAGESGWPNRHTSEPRRVAEWLLEHALVGASDLSEHLLAVLPVTEEARWLDTRRLLPYQSNRAYRYETEKSEVNVAVCDSGWESQLAAILDYHPGISRWVRNERLGWTIPYRYDGMPRQYEPDFVAIAPLENGDELKLVIEVKGLERETDAEKRRWTEEYWLPAVNGDAEFSKAGQWAYLYVDNEPSPAVTGRLITDAIACGQGADV